MYRRITIKPESFGVEQRLEASAIATAEGVGLTMEVHNAHTEFWLNDRVEVGKISVFCPPSYKAPLEYVGTLDSPEQDWYPGTVLDNA